MIQIHQSLREFILHFFHFRIFLKLLLLQSIFRQKETADFYKEIKNKGLLCSGFPPWLLRSLLALTTSLVLVG